MLGMCRHVGTSVLSAKECALFEIASATPGHAANPIFAGLFPSFRSSQTESEEESPEVPNLWYAFPWGYAKGPLGVHEIKLLIAEIRKHKGLKK
ncbi:hypothetical protein AVEN_272648-1 [Araneus ventricosus]|uniref:Uncharacterized protein n=1 Tax=Araneus ventricosus TaxID=182803 RepID=A0A4Y2VMZ5_ARAVE|nr:hypothetical protein AVEN_272648-1 [Araneus ventricosus]